MLREAGIGLALVLLCIIFAIAAPRFASPINLTNILTQISINTVLAVGMTFTILLGGIDLSVGSVLALATIIAGQIIVKESYSVPIAILFAVLGSLAVSMVCGLFNGYVSERWKIHPFITTLGMLNVARGTALQVSQSRTIFNFPPAFNAFGSVEYFGVPFIFVIALATVFLGRFVLNRTVYGRMIYAIGNNEEAVRLSGHNPSYYKVLAYVLC